MPVLVQVFTDAGPLVFFPTFSTPFLAGSADASACCRVERVSGDRFEIHTCPVLSTHLVEWVSLMLNGVRQLLLQHQTQCLSRVLLLLQLENLDFKLRNSLLHSELNPRNICLAPIRCLGRALLLVLVFEVVCL